jgi:ATP-dependent exoDNAse (exonuclease V) beta subunit
LYYLQKQLKLSEDLFQDNDDTQTPLPQMSASKRGNLYHKTMELWDYSANSLDNAIKFATKELQMSWIQEEQMKEIKETLLSLHKMDLINILKDDKYTPYKELEFLYKLNNSTLVGVIDLLLISNNQCVIVDYKTGHRSWKDLADEHEFQLGLYALAAFSLPQLKEVNSINTHLWYIDQEHISSNTIKRKDLGPIKDKAIHLSKEILSNNYQKVMKGCENCTWLGICEKDI